MCLQQLLPKDAQQFTLYICRRISCAIGSKCYTYQSTKKLMPVVIAGASCTLDEYHTCLHAAAHMLSSNNLHECSQAAAWCIQAEK